MVDHRPKRPSIFAAAALAAAAFTAAPWTPLASISLAADAEEDLPSYLVWPPYMRHKSVPAAGVFAGVEGDARFETNGLGIRGPDFDAPRKKQYRILFLGGSAAECFYLDQDEAWPALAGSKLARTADGRKVWVGNIGRSGHNSRDHVLELRLLVPRLSVDAVAVMMGVNDLGLRLAQDAAHDPDFIVKEDNLDYQIRHAFTVRPDDPNVPFYRKGVVGRLLGLDPDAAKRKPHQVVDNAGLAFQRWRDLRRTGGIVEDLPPMEGALAEYARNAEEIVRRGREAGLRIILITQPALWRDGLTAEEAGTLWMGGIGDYQEQPGASYYSAAALGRGLAAYNKTLLDVCARTGAECLDLAAKVKQDLSVFYDDCHFNEAGARAVAGEVAGFFAGSAPFRK